MAIRNRQMTRAGSAPRLVRDETPKLFRLQDAGYDDARRRFDALAATVDATVASSAKRYPSCSNAPSVAGRIRLQ